MTTILTKEEVAERIDRSCSTWTGDCHGVSLQIVRAGIFPDARVARGWALGVRSQHSWVVLGDPYDLDTVIVDPTLWCYRDDVDCIWYGSLRRAIHQPHGFGSIWQYGAPSGPVEDVIEVPGGLANCDPSVHAFLAACGPLDRRGWSFVANAPVQGWPAAEVYRLMDQMGLKPLIPVDHWAMVMEGGYR